MMSKGRNVFQSLYGGSVSLAVVVLIAVWLPLWVSSAVLNCSDVLAASIGGAAYPIVSPQGATISLSDCGSFSSPASLMIINGSNVDVLISNSFINMVALNQSCSSCSVSIVDSTVYASGLYVTEGLFSNVRFVSANITHIVGPYLKLCRLINLANCTVSTKLYVELNATYLDMDATLVRFTGSVSVATNTSIHIIVRNVTDLPSARIPINKPNVLAGNISDVALILFTNTVMVPGSSMTMNLTDIFMYAKNSIVGTLDSQLQSLMIYARGILVEARGALLQFGTSEINTLRFAASDVSLASTSITIDPIHGNEFVGAISFSGCILHGVMIEIVNASFTFIVRPQFFAAGTQVVSMFRCEVHAVVFLFWNASMLNTNGNAIAISQSSSWMVMALSTVTDDEALLNTSSMQPQLVPYLWYRNAGPLLLSNGLRIGIGGGGNSWCNISGVGFSFLIALSTNVTYPTLNGNVSIVVEDMAMRIFSSDALTVSTDVVHIGPIQSPEKYIMMDSVTVVLDGCNVMVDNTAPNTTSVSAVSISAMVVRRISTAIMKCNISTTNQQTRGSTTVVNVDRVADVKLLEIIVSASNLSAVGKTYSASVIVVHDSFSVINLANKSAPVPIVFTIANSSLYASTNKRDSIAVTIAVYNVTLYALSRKAIATSLTWLQLAMRVTISSSQLRAMAFGDPGAASTNVMVAPSINTTFTVSLTNFPPSFSIMSCSGGGNCSMIVYRGNPMIEVQSSTLSAIVAPQLITTGSGTLVAANVDEGYSLLNSSSGGGAGEGVMGFDSTSSTRTNIFIALDPCASCFYGIWNNVNISTVLLGNSTWVALLSNSIMLHGVDVVCFGSDSASAAVVNGTLMTSNVTWQRGVILRQRSDSQLCPSPRPRNATGVTSVGLIYSALFFDFAGDHQDVQPSGSGLVDSSTGTMIAASWTGCRLMMLFPNVTSGALPILDSLSVSLSELDGFVPTPYMGGSAVQVYGFGVVYLEHGILCNRLYITLLAFNVTSAWYLPSPPLSSSYPTASAVRMVSPALDQQPFLMEFQMGGTTVNFTDASSVVTLEDVTSFVAGAFNTVALCRLDFQIDSCPLLSSQGPVVSIVYAIRGTQTPQTTMQFSNSVFVSNASNVFVYAKEIDAFTAALSQTQIMILYGAYFYSSSPNIWLLSSSTLHQVNVDLSYSSSLISYPGVASYNVLLQTLSLTGCIEQIILSSSQGSSLDAMRNIGIGRQAPSGAATAVATAPAVGPWTIPTMLPAACVLSIRIFATSGSTWVVRSGTVGNADVDAMFRRCVWIAGASLNTLLIRLTYAMVGTSQNAAVPSSDVSGIVLFDITGTPNNISNVADYVDIQIYDSQVVLTHYPSSLSGNNIVRMGASQECTSMHITVVRSDVQMLLKDGAPPPSSGGTNETSYDAVLFLIVSPNALDGSADNVSVQIYQSTLSVTSLSTKGAAGIRFMAARDAETPLHVVSYGSSQLFVDCANTSLSVNTAAQAGVDQSGLQDGYGIHVSGNVCWSNVVVLVHHDSMLTVGSSLTTPAPLHSSRSCIALEPLMGLSNVSMVVDGVNTQLISDSSSCLICVGPPMQRQSESWSWSSPSANGEVTIVARNGSVIHGGIYLQNAMCSVVAVAVLGQGTVVLGGVRLVNSRVNSATFLLSGGIPPSLDATQLIVTSEMVRSAAVFLTTTNGAGWSSGEVNTAFPQPSAFGPPPLDISNKSQLYDGLIVFCDAQHRQTNEYYGFFRVSTMSDVTLATLIIRNVTTYWGSNVTATSLKLVEFAEESTILNLTMVLKNVTVGGIAEVTNSTYHTTLALMHVTTNSTWRNSTLVVQQLLFRVGYYVFGYILAIESGSVMDGVAVSFSDSVLHVFRLLFMRVNATAQNITIALQRTVCLPLASSGRVVHVDGSMLSAVTVSWDNTMPSGSSSLSVVPPWMLSQGLLSSEEQEDPWIMQAVRMKNKSVVASILFFYHATLSNVTFDSQNIEVEALSGGNVFSGGSNISRTNVSVTSSRCFVSNGSWLQFDDQTRVADTYVDVMSSTILVNGTRTGGTMSLIALLEVASAEEVHIRVTNSSSVLMVVSTVSFGSVSGYAVRSSNVASSSFELSGQSTFSVSPMSPDTVTVTNMIGLVMSLNNSDSLRGITWLVKDSHITLTNVLSAVLTVILWLNATCRQCTVNVTGNTTVVIDTMMYSAFPISLDYLLTMENITSAVMLIVGTVDNNLTVRTHINLDFSQASSSIAIYAPPTVRSVVTMSSVVSVFAAIFRQCDLVVRSTPGVYSSSSRRSFTQPTTSISGNAAYAVFFQWVGWRQNSRVVIEGGSYHLQQNALQFPLLTQVKPTGILYWMDPSLQKVSGYGPSAPLTNASTSLLDTNSIVVVTDVVVQSNSTPCIALGGMTIRGNSSVLVTDIACALPSELSASIITSGDPCLSAYEDTRVMGCSFILLTDVILFSSSSVLLQGVRADAVLPVRVGSLPFFAIYTRVMASSRLVVDNFAAVAQSGSLVGGTRILVSDPGSEFVISNWNWTHTSVAYQGTIWTYVQIASGGAVMFSNLSFTAVPPASLVVVPPNPTTFCAIYFANVDISHGTLSLTSLNVSALYGFTTATRTVGFSQLFLSTAKSVVSIDHATLVSASNYSARCATVYVQNSNCTAGIFTVNNSNMYVNSSYVGSKVNVVSRSTALGVAFVSSLVSNLIITVCNTTFETWNVLFDAAAIYASMSLIVNVTIRAMNVTSTSTSGVGLAGAVLVYSNDMHGLVVNLSDSVVSSYGPTPGGVFVGYAMNGSTSGLPATSTRVITYFLSLVNVQCNLTATRSQSSLPSASLGPNGLTVVAMVGLPSVVSMTVSLMRVECFVHSPPSGTPATSATNLFAVISATRFAMINLDTVSVGLVLLLTAVNCTATMLSDTDVPTTLGTVTGLVHTWISPVSSSQVRISGSAVVHGHALTLIQSFLRVTTVAIEDCLFIDGSIMLLSNASRVERCNVTVQRTWLKTLPSEMMTSPLIGSQGGSAMYLVTLVVDSSCTVSDGATILYLADSSSVELSTFTVLSSTDPSLMPLLSSVIHGSSNATTIARLVDTSLIVSNVALNVSAEGIVSNVSLEGTSILRLSNVSIIPYTSLLTMTGVSTAGGRSTFLRNVSFVGSSMLQLDQGRVYGTDASLVWWEEGLSTSTFSGIGNRSRAHVQLYCVNQSDSLQYPQWVSGMSSHMSRWRGVPSPLQYDNKILFNGAGVCEGFYDMNSNTASATKTNSLVVSHTEDTPTPVATHTEYTLRTLTYDVSTSLPPVDTVTTSSSMSPSPQTLTMQPTLTLCPNLNPISPTDIHPSRAPLYDTFSGLVNFSIAVSTAAAGIVSTDGVAALHISSTWGTAVPTSIAATGLHSAMIAFNILPPIVKNFASNVLVTFTVSVDGFCEPRYVSVELEASTLPTPPAARAAGQVVTTVAGLLTAVTPVGSVGSAGALQRSMLLLQLSACEFSLAEPVPVSDSPTQLGVPPEENFSARGAVLGDAAIVVGGVVLTWCAAIGIRWNRHAIQRVTPSWRDDTMLSAWGTITRMPGALIVPLSLWTQPMIGQSVTLFLYSRAWYDALIGSLGVLLTLSIVLLFTWKCSGWFGDVHTLIECKRRLAPPRRQSKPLLSSWLMWWTIPHSEWRPRRSSSQTWGDGARRYQDGRLHLLRYGFAFEEFLPGKSWFFLTDVGASIVCGVLSGIKPTAATGCTALSIVLLVLCAALLCVNVWLRPRATQLGNAISIINAGCGVASCVLLLGDLPTASDLLGLILVGVNALLTVFGVTEALMKVFGFSWRDTEDDDLSEGEEDGDNTKHRAANVFGDEHLRALGIDVQDVENVMQQNERRFSPRRIVTMDPKRMREIKIQRPPGGSAMRGENKMSTHEQQRRLRAVLQSCITRDVASLKDYLL